MTTQSTMDKLIEMRLTAMSDAFRTQISDPKMKEISFEDRFGMLVDIAPDSTSRTHTLVISTILLAAS